MNGIYTKQPSLVPEGGSSGAGCHWTGFVLESAILSGNLDAVKFYLEHAPLGNGEEDVWRRAMKRAVHTLRYIYKTKASTDSEFFKTLQSL